MIMKLQQQTTVQLSYVPLFTYAFCISNYLQQENYESTIGCCCYL